MPRNCQNERGAWREGLALMEGGIRTLDAGAVDVGWECATGRSSCHNALLWLGEIAQIGLRAPGWSRSGERVGDLFSHVKAELYCAIVEVFSDDPSSSRARVRRAIARWSESGFHFQHWLALKVEVFCDLYEGDTEAAFERVARAFRALEPSGLLRIQLKRTDAHLLRGTVAIAASRRDPGRLDSAVRDAALLAAEGRPAAVGAATLLRAGVASARGSTAEGQAAYARAARELGDADIRLHAACATLACDVVSPADAARASRAVALLEGEGIVRPERFMRVLAPVPR